MLTFLGEWFHWLSLSWRRRKKLERPATAAELLNPAEKGTWTIAELQELKNRRYQVLADEVEAGRYDVDSVEVFPWDRRRGDDE